MNRDARIEAEERLRRAEEALNEGRPADAWDHLRAAYDDAQQGASPGEIEVLGRKVLLRWLEVSAEHRLLEDRERRPVLIERLLAGAASLVRLPRVVEDVVALFVEQLEDRDRRTIELYVAILEEMPNLTALEPRRRQRLLRALAEALKVRPESTLDEARERRPLLERLHAARPTLAFVRLYLARADSLFGRFERALELLRGLRGELAEHPKTLTLRGLCAERISEWQEAEECYRRSLELKPQGVAHHCLGRVLFRRYQGSSAAEAPL